MSVSLLDPRLQWRPAPAAVTGPPLRIAIVASASLPIPPFDGYGGTQRGIHDLIEVLRRRGHHVTLCGPGDSLTEVDERIAPIPRSLWSADSPFPVADREHLAEVHVREVAAALRGRSFDLINVRHDHYGLVEELLRQDRAPIVYSLHNVASKKTIPIVRDFGSRLVITAHCDAHRAQYEDADDILQGGTFPSPLDGRSPSSLPPPRAPRAEPPGSADSADERIRVVFYGMDVGAYPFGAEPLGTARETPTLPLLRRLQQEGRDYLVSLGRVAVEKGQRSAIAIARRAGMPLLVVGEPFAREPGGDAYFRDHVLPQVDGRTIFYYGSANEVEKRELLRFARGLLFTTGMERPEWKEPFGRVFMEALATGTPIIAHAHGSAPEIVVPEVGFLCDNVDEMVAATRRVHLINRRACRRYARLALSRERMGRDYESLFQEVVLQRRDGRAGVRLAATG